MSLLVYLGAVPWVASKERDLVADIGAGRDADAANLGGQRVTQVVAVEIGRGDHVVFRGRSNIFWNMISAMVS